MSTCPHKHGSAYFGNSGRFFLMRVESLNVVLTIYYYQSHNDYIRIKTTNMLAWKQAFRQKNYLCLLPDNNQVRRQKRRKGGSWPTDRQAWIKRSFYRAWVLSGVRLWSKSESMFSGEHANCSGSDWNAWFSRYSQNNILSVPSIVKPPPLISTIGFY